MELYFQNKQPLYYIQPFIGRIRRIVRRGFETLTTRGYAGKVTYYFESLGFERRKKENEKSKGQREGERESVFGCRQNEYCSDKDSGSFIYIFFIPSFSNTFFYYTIRRFFFKFF